MTEVKTQVLVIGAGPGGYSAAFRCADLGLQTVIVERHPTLGGVCLNVGCIPSKALLHVAKVIEEAKHIEKAGIFYESPKIDIKKVAEYKSGVVKKLTGGLDAMAKMRKVEHIQGVAKFLDEHSVEVELVSGEKTKVTFDYCIVAAGSQSSKMSFIPHEDPRIWDSTNALEVKEVPKKLLILGGGIRMSKSINELVPNLFAPCTETHAASPIANSPSQIFSGLPSIGRNTSVR